MHDFSRYFPTDPRAEQWGWQLIDAGRQIVNAGSDYPSRQHPRSYHFGADGRRTLDEFQVVFITQGTGSFESASCGIQVVRASEVMLIFPGEWHAYKPEQATGWSEYWVGFRGREASRIMGAFFSPDRPRLPIGHGDLLIRHFDRMLGWLEHPAGAQEQILASHIPMILALILSSQTEIAPARSRENELVMQAKRHMLADLQAQTDFAELARRLGLSYSSFRFAFKRQTGFGPREFENLMRLNRARDLLLRERKSVAETAAALGFSSIYYFSKAYKRHFGFAPSQTVSQCGREDRKVEGGG